MKKSSFILQKEHIRRKLLSCFIFIAILCLLLIVYYSYCVYRSIAYNTKITAYFSNQGNIPKSEIIVIENTHGSSWGVAFYPSSFDKMVTTKKDYENWKRLVKERGKLFSEDKIPNEDYLKNAKNCKFTYGVTYTVSTTYLSYSFFVSGERNYSEKFITDHFAYLPNKKILRSFGVE